MDSTGFVSSFSGTTVGSKQSFSARAVSPRKAQTTRREVVAVLGSRTNVSSFGTPQTTQTYTVKVMEKDRCTLVEVDRETNLRKALLDAKVDLYTLGGKLRNCGGGGQCGTCLIDVEDGIYSTNGRTPREEHVLGNKPESWRLACRTLIHGDVTIRTKPKE